MRRGPTEGVAAAGRHVEEAWEMAVDSASGSPYYYNRALGLSQWEVPAELAARKLQPAAAAEHCGLLTPQPSERFRVQSPEADILAAAKLARQASLDATADDAQVISLASPAAAAGLVATVSPPGSGGSACSRRSNMTPRRFASLANFWKVRAAPESAAPPPAHAAPAPVAADESKAPAAPAPTSRAIKSRLRSAGFEVPKTPEASAAEVAAGASPDALKTANSEAAADAASLGAASTTPSTGSRQSSGDSLVTPPLSWSSSRFGSASQRLGGLAAFVVSLATPSSMQSTPQPSSPSPASSPLRPAAAGRVQGALTKAACTSIATPESAAKLRRRHRLLQQHELSCTGGSFSELSSGQRSSYGMLQEDDNELYGESELELALELVNHVPPSIADHLIERLRAAEDARVVAEEQAECAAKAAERAIAEAEEAERPPAPSARLTRGRRWVLLLATLAAASASLCLSSHEGDVRASWQAARVVLGAVATSVPACVFSSGMQCNNTLTTQLQVQQPSCGDAAAASPGDRHGTEPELAAVLNAVAATGAAAEAAAAAEDVALVCGSDASAEEAAQGAELCEALVRQAREETVALQRRRQEFQASYQQAISSVSGWLTVLRSLPTADREGEAAAAALDSACAEAATPAIASLQALLGLVSSAAPAASDPAAETSRPKQGRAMDMVADRLHLLQETTARLRVAAQQETLGAELAGLPGTLPAGASGSGEDSAALVAERHAAFAAELSRQEDLLLMPVSRREL
eukprot:TRINITY_DN14379_c0_g1_i2.p1 TRINITY_DN14379_c0_g1~~TRINITY_DN14379_c0_g1_i2.p1  ORF type:complete len:755 (+),score=201.77 TRINITY_DN14379_c0_g1_i2:198-2462(+)